MAENRDCCPGWHTDFSLERLITQRSMVFEDGATLVAVCHCCAACCVRIDATPRIDVPCSHHGGKVSGSHQNSRTIVISRTVENRFFRKARFVGHFSEETAN
jgi:hypothetical protein